MKKVLIILALVIAFAFAADSYLVEDPGGGGTGTDDLLQYDDGTGHWIVFGPNCFGTWFDVTDFMPGATGFECNYTEWWFYHHTSLPWDTDQMVLELWNGDVLGVTTILAQNTVTAQHILPNIVTYTTPITTMGNFWMVSNSSVFSTQGLPSFFFDEFGNFTGEQHTFSSDDMVLWDPVLITGTGEYVDALFRAEGTITTALDSESWGAIKGLFR